MNPAETDLKAVLAERLAALEPARLELVDESHLHAGHAGARGGARHFRVRIVSNQFQGLGTLARHRLVYDCVRDLMPHPIHALAIEAGTPPIEGFS
ncbi:BolA family protein [Castellaniella denitrificans]|jgi:BolA protein|uniref:BolA family protein n=1 Tax=Castellaniella denitrificans TaxID=56119 RepID=UPI001AD3CA4C|nr:BolA family transcriptional regulator [Burkholderiales bacterium]